MISKMVQMDLSDLDNCYQVECPKCLAPLVLHQPDIDSPDRMLAICGDCHAWYLLDDVDGVMAQLRELSDLRCSQPVPA
jgi:hypothetical protein